MVDALVSGASVERRVGSSPILGTNRGVTAVLLPVLFVVVAVCGGCLLAGDVSRWRDHTCRKIVISEQAPIANFYANHCKQFTSPFCTQ